MRKKSRAGSFMACLDDAPWTRPSLRCRRMPSCSAFPTSRSCMARRMRRSLSRVRRNSVTAGLAITDECSLAGVVRAHVAAKEAELPLVIGSYFQLVNADGSPAFGLILLAKNREGYGNLSELITLARMRAPKGEYRLTPHDLSRPDREYRASARHAGLPRDSGAGISRQRRRAGCADRVAGRNISRTRMGRARAASARDGRYPSRRGRVCGATVRTCPWSRSVTW